MGLLCFLILFQQIVTQQQTIKHLHKLVNATKNDLDKVREIAKMQVQSVTINFNFSLSQMHSVHSI